MSTTTALLLGLLLGAGIGAVLGWLLAGRRQLSQLHAVQLRAERAEAQLAAERSVAQDRFAALANDALATSSDQFLTLAQQRFAADHQTQVGELTAREQAFRQLLEPLNRTLDEVRNQLTATEHARAEGHAALGAQVHAMREDAERLRGQTAQLVTALHTSQVRGRWGEVQLRRVVEVSGMLPHVDFVEQAHVRTDDGPLRPDLVVRLAGGKQVVVDAKVPFLGFLDAAATDDPAGRATAMAAHARQLRAHVDSLASKRYWEQFAPAPEFVVMFVPVESFLPAALDIDPTIVEYAFERQVVLATPTSLLALLRTVAYAWRQDALADNAQAVLSLGKELHGRLATMGAHLARLGRTLESAAGAYNQTVASLETRVLVSARRFASLEVVDEELATPASVDLRLSRVGAPELLASVHEQVVPLDDPASASG
jgi:DNA recombination protein RmuC